MTHILAWLGQNPEDWGRVCLVMQVVLYVEWLLEVAFRYPAGIGGEHPSTTTTQLCYVTRNGEVLSVLQICSKFMRQTYSNILLAWKSSSHDLEQGQRKVFTLLCPRWCLCIQWTSHSLSGFRMSMCSAHSSFQSGDFWSRFYGAYYL